MKNLLSTFFKSGDSNNDRWPQTQVSQITPKQIQIQINKLTQEMSKMEKQLRQKRASTRYRLQTIEKAINQKLQKTAPQPAQGPQQQKQPAKTPSPPTAPAPQQQKQPAKTPSPPKAPQPAQGPQQQKQPAKTPSPPTAPAQGRKPISSDTTRQSIQLKKSLPPALLSQIGKGTILKSSGQVPQKKPDTRKDLLIGIRKGRIGLKPIDGSTYRLKGEQQTQKTQIKKRRDAVFGSGQSQQDQQDQDINGNNQQQKIKLNQLPPGQKNKILDTPHKKVVQELLKKLFYIVQHSHQKEDKTLRDSISKLYNQRKFCKKDIEENTKLKQKIQTLVKANKTKKSQYNSECQKTSKSQNTTPTPLQQQKTSGGFNVGLLNKAKAKASLSVKESQDEDDGDW